MYQFDINFLLTTQLAISASFLPCSFFIGFINYISAILIFTRFTGTATIFAFLLIFSAMTVCFHTISLWCPKKDLNLHMTKNELQRRASHSFRCQPHCRVSRNSVAIYQFSIGSIKKIRAKAPIHKLARFLFLTWNPSYTTSFGALTMT